MRQIPGKLYDFKETVEITPEEGARWHLIQTMAGDNTDGYAGVPGIGVKKAEKIFAEKGYTWKAVVETFEEKDMTEEDALVNARLARILTTDDYDHEKENQSSGNLWDSTKLTLHQDLEMREIQLALYEIDKETMMELYMRLQEQVFKLNNLISPHC